jgi:CelD/BcsL family acetyltransferase involved in cellulose biosynthesis
MREGLRYESIRNSNGLEQLAPEWTALWRADEHATPFQSPAWLVPWWHCFGAELWTIAIRRHDALVGLLPFYVYCEPRSGERQLLPLGVGTTDYLDGVFSPQLSVEDVSGGLELLYAQDGWDALIPDYCFTSARPVPDRALPCAG